MKAIETDAQITSIRSRADGSLGFSGVTPELTVEQAIEFMRYHNVYARMFLHPVDTNNLEELKIDKEAGAKSPSERLRSVIFVLWKQKGSKIPFEVFYREKLENVIDIFKSKLL